MQLPADGAVLLSLINMKLRDAYASLDELCDDLEIDRTELVARLRAAGFGYDAQTNRFC